MEAANGNEEASTALIAAIQNDAIRLMGTMAKMCIQVYLMGVLYATASSAWHTKKQPVVLARCGATLIQVLMMMLMMMLQTRPHQHASLEGVEASTDPYSQGKLTNGSDAAQLHAVLRELLRPEADEVAASDQASVPSSKQEQGLPKPHLQGEPAFGGHTELQAGKASIEQRGGALGSKTQTLGNSIGTSDVTVCQEESEASGIAGQRLTAPPAGAKRGSCDGTWDWWWRGEEGPGADGHPQSLSQHSTSAGKDGNGGGVDTASGKCAGGGEGATVVVDSCSARDGSTVDIRGASSTTAPSCTPLQQPPSPPPSPPPPMSQAPRDLTHPGYLPHGYLRRPYALQLAWAAAVWHHTGEFPYPAVQQQRPPLLREADVFTAAVAEMAALLPELMPPGHNSSTLSTPPPSTSSAEAPPSSSPVEQSPTTTEAPQPSPAEAPSACSGTPPGSSPPPPGGALDAAAPQAPGSALARLLLRPPLVYLLLGFRLTAGSATRVGVMVPLPSVCECWAAFEERHAPPGNASVLTVGARALTKHTHRDLRGEWWPRMNGSEPAKNQMARGSLLRLLSGAVWLNVHQLPPFDQPKFVLELRNVQGYGARWAIEDRPAARRAATAASRQTTPVAPGTALPVGGPGRGGPRPSPPSQFPPPPPPARARTCELPDEGEAQGSADKRVTQRVGPQATQPHEGAFSAADDAPGAGAAVGAGAGGANAAAKQDTADGCDQREESTPSVSGTSGDRQGDCTVLLQAAADTQGTAMAPAPSPPAVVTRDPGGLGPSASAEPPRLSVLFRGFLEPQMEDGHGVGWRH